MEYPKGAWYYFDKETGIKRKGWVEDKGSWYYLNQLGLMQTGWINDNGVWYYLDKSSRRMLANTTIEICTRKFRSLDRLDITSSISKKYFYYINALC